MLEKMISEQCVDAVRKVVENGRRFVVLAHKNPDGDAVGSTLAMCHYLRSIGKEAVVALPNAFPAFLSWMPGADEVLFYDTRHVVERLLRLPMLFSVSTSMCCRAPVICVSCLCRLTRQKCSLTIIHSHRTSLMCLCPIPRLALPVSLCSG